MSHAVPLPDETLRERLQRLLGDSYVIARELGGGGSAHVFLATEVALQRQVVLKVLPSEFTHGVDGARFHREILIAARLQHPHLVPLLSASEPHSAEFTESFAEPALRWYTMPFIDGQSLREHLTKRAPLPLHEALRLLREMAAALSYAHAKGVIHRDIKPENILLSDGLAMISDFGVAKALDDASAEAYSNGRRVTTVSMALGTPAYMAPEQATNSRVVDHKADLYAFACVAYELLTGNPPFVRPSLRATMAAHIAETPTPLLQHRSDIPGALADVLMRCLEKDPLQRPHSASVVVKVLDSLAAPVPEKPSSPTPSTAFKSSRRPPLQHPLRSPLRPLLMVVAVTLLVAGMWWLGRS